ncbi:MAG TPA: ABC transporter permease [Thermomicrobiales bacterium]|nr:ABC transporter permease [Thermomicrobiales bacterium]HRA47433.1 ABC transporter permease [Thermomicrobiales bacterium]
MFNYIVRRLIISVVTLIVISMVVFGILKIAPGDPLAGFANNPNVPLELRAKIRKNMGLDDPIPVQYAKWARSYIRGDWGQSFLSKAPARDIVVNRLPVTLKIVGSAFVLSVLIAIPIGVISAIKQYSAFDQIATTFAFLGFSLPTFFSGLVMIWLFSFKLGWFPFVYDKTTTGFWPNIEQSIMPVTVLALANSASLTRFVRASMLEVINQDYVRTARAKGLREQGVIIFHAMRNAMIPVVTIIALQIPEVVGGAIITEQIFRVPGVGSLLIDSIGAADHPVVMGISMMIAIAVVLFNIVADLIYALLDPRIKLT